MEAAPPSPNYMMRKEMTMEKTFIIIFRQCQQRRPGWLWQPTSIRSWDPWWRSLPETALRGGLSRPTEARRAACLWSLTSPSGCLCYETCGGGGAAGGGAPDFALCRDRKQGEKCESFCNANSVIMFKNMDRHLWQRHHQSVYRDSSAFKNKI